MIYTSGQEKKIYFVTFIDAATRQVLPNTMHSRPKVSNPIPQVAAFIFYNKETYHRLFFLYGGKEYTPHSAFCSTTWFSITSLPYHSKPSRITGSLNGTLLKDICSTLTIAKLQVPDISHAVPDGAFIWNLIPYPQGKQSSLSTFFQHSYKLGQMFICNRLSLFQIQIQKANSKNEDASQFPIRH